MRIISASKVLGDFDLPGKIRVSPRDGGMRAAADTGVGSAVISPAAAADSAALQAATASVIAHGTTAYLQAGDAIASITKELAAASRAIKVAKPSLNDTQWDFSLKDGKLIAKGAGLSKADEKVVEDVLNGNAVLVDAVKSFVGAAVLNLQATPDYQGGTTDNLYGGLRPISFNDVAKQLDGSIDFKHLLAKNENLATAGGRSKVTDGTRGLFALGILGSQLNSNNSNNSNIGFTVFPPAGTV